MIWPQLAQLDPVDIRQHLIGISPLQWGLSAVFTAVSYFAISQYDNVAHRHFGVKAPAHKARQAGAAAIGVSQLLGFGAVTATLVRWRLFKGGLAKAHAKHALFVTAFVSLLFLVSSVTLCAVLWLVLPTPRGLGWVAGLILLLAICAVGLTLAAPYIRVKGKQIRLPSLKAISSSFSLAAVDCIGATLALYVLLPTEFSPPLLAFIPICVAAMLLGLYSGAPSGAGAFELTLLTFTATGLPAETDKTALVAAILGFRLTYFLIPGGLALTFIFRRGIVAIKDVSTPSDAKITELRAETQVITQNGGRLETVGSNVAALWPTGQALVALFDPGGRDKNDFFEELNKKAAAQNRSALIYKCSARTASLARRKGWQTLHIADEAILDVKGFTLNCPSRSKLRRKLKQAERADVRFRACQPSDMAMLARIDAAWQDQHGCARGGTMGRFEKDYVNRQICFVAERAGDIIAFVSFHKSQDEWALDLMRHIADIPQGTMHGLICAAIFEAHAQNAAELNLAAIQACPDPDNWIWRELSIRAVGRLGGTGLRQFKSSFGPNWRPVYAAAPTRFALTIGLADVAREVHFPAALRKGSARVANISHENDENYEVESYRVA